MGRMVLHAIGMFIVGAAALIVAGLLQHQHVSQVGRPDVVAATGTSGSADDAGAARLLRTTALRLAAGLDAAAGALDDGRRREGVVALDGAYHVADVLQAAAPSGELADLYPLVAAARTALEDGSPHAAAAIAAGAARLARAADAGVGPAGSASPGAYVGATVLDGRGAQVGEVVAAGGDTLVVESGGLRNILGFLDLSRGQRREVPVDSVIFGQRRRAGMTMVVMAGEE